MNFVTTKTKGWQLYCCEWAKVHEQFELHGIEKQHLPFCDLLSATYQGKYECSPNACIVTFKFRETEVI